jgi:hypothetical protein
LSAEEVFACAVALSIVDEGLDRGVDGASVALTAGRSTGRREHVARRPCSRPRGFQTAEAP